MAHLPIKLQQGPFKKGRLFELGPSKHTVLFDSDKSKKVWLARHGDGGEKFVLLIREQ